MSEDRPFQLAIKLHRDNPRMPASTCGLCGGEVAKKPRGPRLCELYTGELICDECGINQAPSLVALLDLLDAARRLSLVETSSRKITQYGATKSRARKKFNLEVKPSVGYGDKALEGTIRKLLGRDVEE